MSQSEVALGAAGSRVRRPLVPSVTLVPPSPPPRGSSSRSLLASSTSAVSKLGRVALLGLAWLWLALHQKSRNHALGVTAGLRRACSSLQPRRSIAAAEQPESMSEAQPGAHPDRGRVWVRAAQGATPSG
jgi:hypothetical protein